MTKTMSFSWVKNMLELAKKKKSDFKLTLQWPMTISGSLNDV